jgi:hypothetical protein
VEEFYAEASVKAFDGFDEADAADLEQVVPFVPAAGETVHDAAHKVEILSMSFFGMLVACLGFYEQAAISSSPSISAPPNEPVRRRSFYELDGCALVDGGFDDQFVHKRFS